MTVSAGFFVVLTVLSLWNCNPLDGFFAPAPLFFSLVCATALQRALRCQQILLAVYVVQSGLAYSFASVRASHEGARLLGMSPTGYSIDMGLFIAASFVAVVTATSIVLRPRPIARSEPQAFPRPDIRTWTAALLLLAGCFAEAVRFDKWTAYSGGEVAQRVGGFRLELLYATLLTAIVVLLWQEIVARWSVGTRSRRAEILQWSLLAILLVLQFMLQGRRFMITSLIFGGLLVLQSWATVKTALRAPLRRLLLVSVLALVLWGTFLGSNLWRRAAKAYGGSDLSIGTRVQLMADQAWYDSDRGISERMTYLALDAASVEYYDEASSNVALHRMALSSIITALPGTLFPSKYDDSGSALSETCETAFRLLSTSDDLPCTPEAEALLGGGALGIVFVGTLWGVFFALLARLERRRELVWRLVALVGFIPMSLIETSAFPMFQSLRSIALVGGLVWATRAILQRFKLGRHPVRVMVLGRDGQHPRRTSLP